MWTHVFGPSVMPGAPRQAFGVRLLLAFLLTAVHSTATTYYIDYENGNDDNNGTSKSTPWKHLKGMKGCRGACAAHTVLQTDRFVLKGGVVWSGDAFPWFWVAWGSGTTPNPTGERGVYIGYDPTWNKGTVTSIRPTTSGSGCSSLAVHISGGGGAGATATADFMTSGYLKGLLQHVTVTNPGSGYTSNPTVSFSGQCDVLPTAVADIYSPILDMGLTTWNLTNGAQPSYGPIEFYGVNYLVVDHLDFRNMLVDANIAQGSSPLFMITYRNGTGSIWKNIYVHNYGPKFIRLTGSPTFNGTGGLSLNGGYGGLTSEVRDSVFDNYENEVFVPCGWLANGQPANFEPPCGSSMSVAGATLFHHNIVHDSRGQVYSPAEPGLEYYSNKIWNTTYDCCGQHEDTFYFFGSGKIYNNIIHSAAPLGAANLYIETCRPYPCAVGNEVYLFNNVLWGPGRSTPPIGFTSEFWTTNPVSPSPRLYAYNNSFYSQDGTADCIAAGQWYGDSKSAPVYFYLYNNHCITDQSRLHWYRSDGDYGIWNGLRNPNSGASRASIDSRNTVMSPLSAASQGYTTANGLAPTSQSAGTVTAAGTNFTTSCDGEVGGLCNDLVGVARPTAGPWNTGAYHYPASAPAPPLDLRATPED